MSGQDDPHSFSIHSGLLGDAFGEIPKVRDNFSSRSFGILPMLKR
jgi:hypothetical protein